MHSCLGAVKTSMLVIQRAQEAVTAALLAKQSGCTVEEMLSSLLDCYIHILTDGKIQYRLHTCLMLGDIRTPQQCHSISTAWPVYCLLTGVKVLGKYVCFCLFFYIVLY